MDALETAAPAAAAGAGAAHPRAHPYANKGGRLAAFTASMRSAGSVVFDVTTSIANQVSQHLSAAELPDLPDFSAETSKGMGIASNLMDHTARVTTGAVCKAMTPSRPDYIDGMGLLVRLAATGIAHSDKGVVLTIDRNHLQFHTKTALIGFNLQGLFARTIGKSRSNDTSHLEEPLTAALTQLSHKQSPVNLDDSRVRYICKWAIKGLEKLTNTYPPTHMQRIVFEKYSKDIQAALNKKVGGIIAEPPANLPAAAAAPSAVAERKSEVAPALVENSLWDEEQNWEASILEFDFEKGVETVTQHFGWNAHDIAISHGLLCKAQTSVDSRCQQACLTALENFIVQCKDIEFLTLCTEEKDTAREAHSPLDLSSPKHGTRASGLPPSYSADLSPLTPLTPSERNVGAGAEPLKPIVMLSAPGAYQPLSVEQSRGL